MPIPAWNWPEDDSIEAHEVRFALEQLERMQEHEDLSQEQRDIVSHGLESCRNWLLGLLFSEDTKRSVTHNLDQIPYLPRICHAEAERLDILCRSAVILAYDCVELDKIPAHENAQYEEFCDVFEPLTSLLRCEICFGKETYNQLDSRTGRQYDWTYMAMILVNDQQLSLPSWYRVEEPVNAALPKTAEHGSLLRSLMAASNALRMNFKCVAWQIIYYNIYREHLRGPKRALRTGNWEQLSTSIERASVALKAIIETPENSSETQLNAARAVLGAVRCTGLTWFDFRPSSGDFFLSDRAYELNRRLAENGDPRGNLELRCEPLFGVEVYGCNEWIQSRADTRLTYAHRLFGGDRQRSDHHVRSLATSAQARQASNLPTLLGGQPSRGTQTQANLEPIPGYILPAWRRISGDRASAILNAYERMMDISYQHHAAIFDINFTLLVAIMHPTYYRTSFIEILTTHAGQTTAELAASSLVRIPGRGLASKASFDGFFEVNMDRYRVPSDAERVVEQIIEAYEQRNDAVFHRYHDLHRTAQIYEPLYNPSRVLALVPLLQEMRGYPPPTDASPEERQRITLRLVDLTLTFYNLIVNPELVPVAAAEDYRVFVQIAGERESVLNRAGYARNSILGLIPRGGDSSESESGIDEFV